MARELPNFSLAGYWWHNFFPDVIRQVIAERLDMLPVNKQVGFFSDAYCVDWTYGKTILMRKQLVYQALSNEHHRQSYFSSDPSLRRGFGRQEGGKTGVMPKHNALCPDIHRRGGFFQRRAEGKEQVYGGQDLVLGALAIVLADKVEQGQFTVEQAMTVAKSILYDSPQTLLGMVPRQLIF